MSDDCRELPPECWNTPPKTLCNRDRTSNSWMEGGNHETGEGGVCLLDNLTERQVIYILERDEVARDDLLRVTDDPRLLELGHTIARLPLADEGPPIPGLKNTDVPFYSVFRGQPPFAQ